MIEAAGPAPARQPALQGDPWPVDSTEDRSARHDQGPGPRTPTLAWAFGRGAGDENRTRTISLGSVAVTAARGADQPGWLARGGRGCPLVTLVNGTLMARRSKIAVPVNHLVCRRPSPALPGTPGGRPPGVERRLEHLAWL